MEAGEVKSQKCIENACDNDGDNGGQPSYQLIGTLKEGGWNGRVIAIGIPFFLTYNVSILLCWGIDPPQTCELECC